MQLDKLLFFSLFFSAITCEKDLASYDDASAKNTLLEAGFTSVSRYRIIKDTGICTLFPYQGKGMDFNNFQSIKECENHKKKTTDELFAAVNAIKTADATSPANPPTSLCTGPSERRFYLKKTVNGGSSEYTCEEFEYKGCGAKENIFETRKQCEEFSGINNRPHPNKSDCGKKIYIDNNPDYEKKVVADIDEKKCVYAMIPHTISEGVFNSLKECVDICFSEPKDINLKCNAQISQPKCNKKTIEKYFYNRLTQSCHSYMTEDCNHPSNMNVFDDLADCIGTCKTNHDFPTSDIRNYIKAVDICHQKHSEGHGNLHLVRYYYDHHSSTCYQFIYRGIGGNGNNFLSHQLCLAVCSGKNIPVEKYPKISSFTAPTEDNTVTDSKNNTNTQSPNKPQVGPKTDEEKKLRDELAVEAEKEMSHELQY